MDGSGETDYLLGQSGSPIALECVVEFPSEFEDSELDEPEEEELRTSRWLRRRFNTSLIGAVLDSNADEVARLVKCEASPVARCQESMATVLHLAAIRGEKKILSLLMKEAVKGDKGSSALRLRDVKGRMPLHLAAAAGQFCTLKALLEEDPSLINEQATTDHLEEELNAVPEIELDSYLHRHQDVTALLLPVTEKSTALHIAAKYSFLDICNYLVAKNARVDIVDTDGLNPLDVAGLYSDPTVPGTIISAATPAEYISEDNEEIPNEAEGSKEFVILGSGLRGIEESGIGPAFLSIFQSLVRVGATVSHLHIYVEQNNVKRIQEILNDPSNDLSSLINDVDNKQRTPVHLAVELNLIEPLRLMLEKDNSPVRSGDLQLRTPLHIAVDKEWSEGIELLLQYKPNLMWKTKSDDTVLHVAARKKNPDILRALLERADKSDIEAINQDGYTPLLLAIETGDVRCVEIMIDFNRSTIKSHIKNQKKHHNRNSLAHAAVNGNAVQILRLIKTKLEKEKKFDVAYFNSYNTEGLTPLHLAVVVEANLCLDELLNIEKNVEAKVDQSNKEFREGTVLHIAAKLGRCRALKAIVDHHNCKNLIREKDAKGHEPLILAAFHGHRECVIVLLKNGANLAARDKSSSKTAIDLIYCNIPQCVSILDEIMDCSILKSSHREDSEDLQLTLDYKCILADNSGEGRQLGITETFVNCGHEKLRHKFFLHPLTESFLFFKWKKLKKLYWLVVLIFVLHIAALTGFSLMQFVYNLPQYALLFRSLFIVMVIPIVLLESMNGALDQNYLLDTETWVKWSVIIGSCLVGFSVEYSWSRYVTSFTVLLSWIHLLFLFACNPRWVHVLMFFEVAANVFQVLSLFVFLLLGFAFAFFILFNGVYPFTSLGAALTKVVIMMVELDFNGVFGVDESLSVPIEILGRALYLGFVVLVVMVLTNLMVGMSVTDVTELQNQGKSKRIAKKAQFVVLFEKICYRNSWVRSHITVPDRIEVWPNKMSYTTENPLPSDVMVSLLKAVMKSDDQTEYDYLNEKVDDLVRDVRQIFRMVKNSSKKRIIERNNSM